MSLDERAAARVAADAFGLAAEATALPGERDRNFRLTARAGARFVLKLHHPAADRSALALQDAALRHLEARLPEPAAPRLAAEPAVVTVAGEERVARLLTWLDGTPWAQVPPSPARMEQLGRLVARVDRALADFEHPAMHRELPWNLLEAPAAARLAEHVEPGRRALIAPIFERFETVPLDDLPRQVVHNDANELNVLVDADGDVSALIDFGDVVWSARIAGLAVAGAYAMQGHDDPVRAVAPLVRGYHAAAPLSAAELAALYDLMRTRLAVSVCMAAWQHARDPGNDYLLVSQDAIAALLERLAGESPALAHHRFRDACGYEASPTARRVRQYFESGRARPLAAIDGGAVRAPLDGVVHTVAANDIVLEHRTDGGVAFYTLLEDVTPRCAPGAAVRAGDALGTAGPRVRVRLATDPLALGADADLWRTVRPARNASAILARRRTNLSGALSLAYREPLHIVRGEGAHLYDADGRAWLDLVNNVCHVGHCHPRVVAAAQAQVARLNTNTRYLHDAVVEYARRLAATLPDPLNVCFFVNSGSEANDLALRLATTHTGREDVLVLDHAYHGHLSSLIALSPYKFACAGGRGAPRTTHVCPLPDPYRGTLSGPDLGAVYADAVRERLRGIEPAAFFAETLQSCGGQIVYPDGYLARAFAHVRAAGGVCVADEVQVGFGRVGAAFWGFDLQDAVPDIVTMGKPMGNGHPLAAVVTTPEIAHSFVTGMEYFNTYGGNPVSAEIGLAVLDVIADERLQARANDLGGRLLTGLGELAARHPLIGDVRGRGLFLGVELSRDPATREPATREAAQVKEALKARGILISTDGPDDNVLKIKPPLVIGADDCDRFVDAFDEVLGTF